MLWVALRGLFELDLLKSIEIVVSMWDVYYVGIILSDGTFSVASWRT